MMLYIILFENKDMDEIAFTYLLYLYTTLLNDIKYILNIGLKMAEE